MLDVVGLPIDERLLLATIERNDTVTTRLLIDRHNANVNLNFGGKSLLYLVVERNAPDCRDVIELLLDAGAKIDQQDDWARWTCLMVAIKNCRDDLISLLLERGADPNIEDKFGTNAIYKVMDLCRCNARMNHLRLLMKYGAKPNVSYVPGREQPKCSNIISRCDLEELRYFHELGVIVKNAYDAFPAVYNDDPRVLRYLVENDIFDVEQRLPNGNTALCEAVRNHNENNAEYLLNFDYDVNERANDGETLLCKATNRRLVRTMRLLLLQGAELDLGLVVDFKRQWAEYAYNYDNRHRKVYEMYRRTYAELARHLVLRANIAPTAYPTKHLDLLYRDVPEVYRSCAREIDDLKHVRVIGRVTLYDLLVKTNIARYAKNCRVVDFIEGDDIVGRFPCYGDLIVERFKREIDRRAFFGKARRALAWIFGWNVDCMYGILDNIVSRLNNKDLISVVGSAER